MQDIKPLFSLFKKTPLAPGRGTVDSSCANDN